MATGKQLGEFSFKFTSYTLAPGPAGSVITQGNYEGTGSGFGTIIGTLTVVGGKSGTCSWCGTAYLDNGEQVSGTGSGSYESSGKHHWRVEVPLHLSNGQTLTTEGEVDLATRSWNGKIFEKV